MTVRQHSRRSKHSSSVPIRTSNRFSPLPEAALDESDWGHCSGPAALWFAAYSGWGSPGGGSIILPRRRTQRSPHSPVSFPEDCFCPPSNIEEFVSFGHEEGDDAMSLSASEKEDWAGSEPDHLDSSEPSDLQEELMKVLSKAVQELELTWSPPEEPVRSKLDSWYFRSTRKTDSRASVPFFPDVHEQLVKTWSAPQSAPVHSNTQAIFFPRGWRGGPRVCALSPHRGDRCCTPVSCSSKDPRLRHQPSLEAVQDHHPPR